MLPNQTSAVRRNQAPEVVKSAVRVLDILSFFDRHRGAASVGQVAAGLGFPQSSTSALLRSLMNVGYLHYDPVARTFRPTARVTMLGSWCASPFLNDGPVLKIARSIERRSGLPVAIARRSNREIQWLYMMAENPAEFEGIDGSLHHLLSAPVGIALLTAAAEKDLRGLAHRYNAEKGEGAPPILASDLIARIEAAREDGYSTDTGSPDDGEARYVGMLVPDHLADEPIAICVAAPAGAAAIDLAATIAVMAEEMAGYTPLTEPGRVIPFDSGQAARAQAFTGDSPARHYA